MSGADGQRLIPAYRAAHTIGRAVDSVLAQTRPPDEILVVDDGSPDDVAAALAPYGERVRLLRKANGGAASAAISASTVAAATSSPSSTPTTTGSRKSWNASWRSCNGIPKSAWSPAGFTSRRPAAERACISRLQPSLFDRVWDRPPGPTAFDIARRIWTSVVLVRREALGDRRFDAGLATAEDVDLWVRLVRAAPVYLRSEPLATAVLEAGSLSRGDPADDCRNMLTVVRRHAGSARASGVRAWEAGSLPGVGGGLSGRRVTAAAVAPAWHRWIRQPWSPQAWWIVGKSAVCGGVVESPAATRARGEWREHLRRAVGAMNRSPEHLVMRFIEPKRGRLRVAHVTLGLDVGGQEKLLVEFARCADRRRFDLHFVSLGGRGVLADDLEAHGWPVTALNEPFGFRPGLVSAPGPAVPPNSGSTLSTRTTNGRTFTAPSRLGWPAWRRLIHTRHHGMADRLTPRQTGLVRLAAADRPLCVRLRRQRRDRRCARASRRAWSASSTTAST